MSGSCSGPGRRTRGSHFALELVASFALGAAGTVVVLLSDTLLGEDARPAFYDGLGAAALVHLIAGWHLPRRRRIPARIVATWTGIFASLAALFTWRFLSGGLN